MVRDLLIYGPATRFESSLASIRSDTCFLTATFLRKKNREKKGRVHQIFQMTQNYGKEEEHKEQASFTTTPTLLEPHCLGKEDSLRM